MSWQSVARTDVRESLAGRGVYVLAALLLLAFAGIGYVGTRLSDPSFGAYLELMVAVVAPLFPLLGVLLGYPAVSSERDSGTAVLSLALPNSRASFAAGKLAGRAAVLAGTLVPAAVVAAGYLAFALTGFDPLRYLLFVAATLLFGLAFLGLAVGISMAAGSARRVVGAALGSYILLAMVWGTLVDLVAMLLFRLRAPNEPLGWVEFLKFLAPGNAFRTLVAGPLDVGMVPPAVGDGSFVSPAGALLVLLAWVAVPVALGFLRFRRSEL